MSPTDRVSIATIAKDGQFAAYSEADRHRVVESAIDRSKEALARLKAQAFEAWNVYR